ncbi:DUF1269 domain-containing protein [Methanosarcina sp. T3]|uniref:DUF1269 domain-containing protein n=1 Tax=Methanosarcina sp. T3 TaxID=3439062 RepID=UPI003F84335E
MNELTLGPVQLLVIVFDNPDFHGKIRKELESVMEKGMIRLIGLLFVGKDEKGNVASFKTTQLDEEERMHLIDVIEGLTGNEAASGEGAKKGVEEGASAAARENCGITEEDILEITGAIPESTAAAILVVEHLWAKNLKNAIRGAGGILISQGMLTPELLAATGEELLEVIKAAEKKSGPKSAATV